MPRAKFRLRPSDHLRSSWRRVRCRRRCQPRPRRGCRGAWGSREGEPSAGRQGRTQKPRPPAPGPGPRRLRAWATPPPALGAPPRRWGSWMVMIRHFAGPNGSDRGTDQESSNGGDRARWTRGALLTTGRRYREPADSRLGDDGLTTATIGAPGDRAPGAASIAGPSPACVHAALVVLVAPRGRQRFLNFCVEQLQGMPPPMVRTVTYPPAACSSSTHRSSSTRCPTSCVDC